MHTPKQVQLVNASLVLCKATQKLTMVYILKYSNKALIRS